MDITTEQLELIINDVIMKNVQSFFCYLTPFSPPPPLSPTLAIPTSPYQEEKAPYSFYLNDEEIVESLRRSVETQKADTEQVLPIVFRPQALFRVRPVTRCTGSMTGTTTAF